MKRPAPAKPFRISPLAQARARQPARRTPTPAELQQRLRLLHPKAAQPPPDQTIAMDQDLAEVADWAWDADALGTTVGLSMSSAYLEGLMFLGYPYLAQLAQRPEYRRAVEILSQEMTRKWIRFSAVGGKNGTEGRIKQLDDFLKQLKAKHIFRKMLEHDGYFGRGHLYLDTGETGDRDNLKLPIGDGRDGLSRAKVGRRNPLRALRNVEPVWTYPTNYNSNDPLRDDWYKPLSWFVMGKQIHCTRLLTLISREVPDLLKPAYSFGGLALTQMGKPYVDNWLRTRQSVADVTYNFSVSVLKTNLGETLQADGDKLFERLDFFANCRNNKGVMALDKDSEDFGNVATPLGGLDHIQAQAQEHMSCVWGIPIVKYLGIQPSGLNASSEGEIRTFYDGVEAAQEALLTDLIWTVVHFAQLSLWDEIDDDITWAFVPLWSLDEKSEAELRKVEADTDAVLIDTGVIAPAEARKRVASNPDAPYASIDVEDVPDLKQEEEQGLEPRGHGKGEGGMGGGAEEGGGGSEGHEDAELGAELAMLLPPPSGAGEELAYDPMFPPREQREQARLATRQARVQDRDTAGGRKDDRTDTRLERNNSRNGREHPARPRLDRADGARGRSRLRDRDGNEIENDDPGDPGGVLDARALGALDARAALDAWKEAEHPRGKPGNKGQFTSGGGGGGAAREANGKAAKSEPAPARKEGTRAKYEADFKQKSADWEATESGLDTREEQRLKADGNFIRRNESKSRYDVLTSTTKLTNDLPYYSEFVRTANNSYWYDFMTTPKGIADISMMSVYGADKPTLEIKRLLSMDRGAGRAAMEMLAQAADKHGVHLQLDPVPLEPTGEGRGEGAGIKMSRKKLEKFYAEFGFRQEGERDKGGTITMVRKPKGKQANDAFEEGQHPRGQPGNKGQFAKGSGGGQGGGSGGAEAKPEAKAPAAPAAAPVAKAAPAKKTTAPTVTLQQVGERAFSGSATPTRTKLSKQQTGALGEGIAIAFLKSMGYKDASPVNSALANFPVDLVQDHELIEVKTGLASNGPSAQQWRATIGQPGPAEAAWLKTASKEEKRVHNAKKKAAIMERKAKAIAEFSQQTGKQYTGKTLTMVIDPDRGIADLHVFDGFHHRIAWGSKEANDGYVGSFKYAA